MRSTLVVVFLLAAGGGAQAHFELQQPASWMSQDNFGAPEKLGPCGDEGGGTPTNMVTAFQTGQTINITINEIIYHPGHYRVALAVNDRSELPAEPPVTAASTPCGSVPVMSPPVFPVLADGVLEHSQPFSAPQTIQVKLPDGVTCSKCTLQVIEFMSDHGLNNPGGCFYHHCADLSIQSSTVTVDGGGDGGGVGGGGAQSGGCGCSTVSAPPSIAMAAMCVLLALLLLRRRA
jgi:MYXO-CTERM domain-containing protein